MHIILKEVGDNPSPDIQSVFFNSNDHVAHEAAVNHIHTDIESLMWCPSEKNVKNVQYNCVKVNDTTYKLNKTWKKIKKGYLYNSYETLNETLYNIKILSHDEPCASLNSSVSFLRALNREQLMRFNIKLIESICKIKDDDVLNKKDIISIYHNVLQSLDKKNKKN